MTLAEKYRKSVMGIMTALALLAGTPVIYPLNIKAQTRSVQTNAFRDNWEVSFGIEGMSFYSGREKGLGLSKSPFRDFRTSMGAAASVGKWFTPEIGLRTKASGYWGKAFTIGKEGQPEKATVRFYAFQEQVMANMTNIIAGYKPVRRWDLVLYGGAGFIRNASHNENSIGAGVGIVNSYRIGSHMKLHMDAGVTFAGENYRSDGKETTMGKYHWLSLEAGITFSLGRRTWSGHKVQYSGSNLIYPVNVKDGDKVVADLSNAQYTHVPVDGKTPQGMVLVGRGHIRMGLEKDSIWATATPVRDISVDDFMMDRTEVTNRQYMAFVNDIKDRLITAMVSDSTSRYFKDRSGAEESLYITNPVTGEKAVRRSALTYRYETYDYTASVRNDGSMTVSKDTAYISEDGVIVREKVTRPKGSAYDYVNTYITEIYPDTTCWINDFPNAGNGLYTKFYFTHPDYRDYPVVGVTWEQANAYCAWRTEMLKEELGEDYGDTQPFRLPTEAEWEYAARGNASYTFPWEENTAGRNVAMFRANFMAAEGDYTKDGNIITARVGVYPPNAHGLYDMAGNVAEWTATPFTETGVNDMNNINPQYGVTNADNNIISVRGGSWKDPESHIRSAWRQKEYKDTPRSYIGFRCARSIATKPSGKSVIVISKMNKGK